MLVELQVCTVGSSVVGCDRVNLQEYAHWGVRG